MKDLRTYSFGRRGGKTRLSEDIRDLLELDSKGEGLTGWEVEFVDKALTQTRRRGAPLTDVQRRKLDEIMEERIR